MYNQFSYALQKQRELCRQNQKYGQKSTSIQRLRNITGLRHETNRANRYGSKLA